MFLQPNDNYRKTGVVSGDAAKSNRVAFFFVVEPSKIISLIQNTVPQKEDRILLYNGYHSIPK